MWSGPFFVAFAGLIRGRPLVRLAQNAKGLLVFAVPARLSLKYKMICAGCLVQEACGANLADQVDEHRDCHAHGRQKRLARRR
jgi:hypothetical protein